MNFWQLFKVGKYESFWSKEINYEKFCKNFFNKRYYATNFKKILNFNLNNINYFIKFL